MITSALPAADFPGVPIAGKRSPIATLAMARVVSLVILNGKA